MKLPSEVVADFDAIALALRSAPDDARLTRAERSLLRHVPAHARGAIDVGCGDGLLSRALARRGLTVLALDASEQMITLARTRTDPAAPITYRVGDLMTADLPARSFDAVVAVNVVHHLPLDRVVPRLASLVAPGGVLLIQDVVARGGLRYLPLDASAAIWRRLCGVLQTPRHPPAVQALYEAHGRGEVYLRPGEVAGAFRGVLPGARVYHHLEWRYSVVWRRHGTRP